MGFLTDMSNVSDVYQNQDEQNPWGNIDPNLLGFLFGIMNGPNASPVGITSSAIGSNDTSMAGMMGAPSLDSLGFESGPGTGGIGSSTGIGSGEGGGSNPW
jgi:hypothetical protein